MVELILLDYWRRTQIMRIYLLRSWSNWYGLDGKYALSMHRKKYRKGFYHAYKCISRVYFSFSSSIRMKMFHTEYYWRPLKHLAYFVFVKKIRSVTRGTNFKCFKPEGRMNGDLNSAFGKRKLHALNWFVQSGIALLSFQPSSLYIILSNPGVTHYVLTSFTMNGSHLGHRGSLYMSPSILVITSLFVSR